MTSPENMRGQPDQALARTSPLALGAMERRILISAYHHDNIFHAEQAAGWDAGNTLGAAVRSLCVRKLMTKVADSHRPARPGAARAISHGRASYEYRLTSDGVSAARLHTATVHQLPPQQLMDTGPPQARSPYDAEDGYAAVGLLLAPIAGAWRCVRYVWRTACS